MRFLTRAAVALMIGASGSAALVAPAFAQTCVCPPAEGISSGPVIQAAEPPPPLPEYEQPPIPAAGYTWTPGYWAWNNTDYYWVPGVWVEPPHVGILWTPPYWGFVAGVFLFHPGYWAPHVGFYGGVNYGFGYAGLGYQGGRWENGRFAYNTAVNNLGDVHVGNTYNAPVTISRTTTINNFTNISYNGGQGGIQLKPTPEQEQVVAEPHVPATPAQVSQVRTASVNAEQFHSVNQGKPAVAATPRPGQLQGPGVVPAKAAGAAQTAPAPAPAPAVPAPVQNAPANLPPKAEEKPAPAARLPAAGQPLNASPNAEQKTPPKMKPPGAMQPMNRERPLGARQAPLEEKPLRPEPLNAPKAQEKLPAGERPVGAEKPARPEVAPRGLEKPKEPKEPKEPQGLLKPPAERPVVPAMSASRPEVAQPRPAPVPNALPKAPPAVAERRPPPRPAGKAPQCGKPGTPLCPK